MDAALLTPSKYIKAVGFKGRDVTVTITGVKIEELEKEDKTKEQKGLISLAETAKKWVLNVTNVKCLIQLFGRETDHWIGKRVTLYPEKNEMSDSGFAIRVRGSPDIAKDITFTLKLAKKKPRKVTLKAVGKNGAAAASAPPQDEPEPREPEPEEPPEDVEPGEDLFPDDGTQQATGT